MWLLCEIHFQLFHVSWHMSVTGGNGQIEKKPASCPLMPPEGLKITTPLSYWTKKSHALTQPPFCLQQESALILFQFSC